MKLRLSFVSLGLITALSGCQGLDSNALMQSGAQAYQAATISDAQVKELSVKSCAQMDSEAQIAPDQQPICAASGKISAALGDNINGTPANYKVYSPKTSMPGRWRTAVSAFTAD